MSLIEDVEQAKLASGKNEYLKILKGEAVCASAAINSAVAAGMSWSASIRLEVHRVRQSTSSTRPGAVTTCRICARARCATWISCRPISCW